MSAAAPAAAPAAAVPAVPSPPSSSSIQEFYSGRVMLLTGVTGMVGKAVLEKLLRSCPGVGKVVVVIRGDSQEQAERRFREQVGVMSKHTTNSNTGIS